MSNVNIGRVIDNIRANTTVYTPLIETIVNSIQAIDVSGRTDGVVSVEAIRSAQRELDESLPDIRSFRITDNGIGFTDVNRESFDTLYTDLKLREGGKGFGRFTCLKYFENLLVESDFRRNEQMYHRSFRMGKNKDIIVEEKEFESAAPDTGTTVTLDWLKPDKALDKKLETIARTLVEKLLPYFVTEGYQPPRIVLSEEHGEDGIVLNHFFNTGEAAAIQEIQASNPRFRLGRNDHEESFAVRLFKIFSPKNQKSRVSLIAHKREVSATSLHDYVPEFAEEFCEAPFDGSLNSRNFILKAYVFSDFLDRRVSIERGSFDLAPTDDDLFAIQQDQIEEAAAEIAKSALGEEITTRQDRKKKKIQAYVERAAPWHRHLLSTVDISTMPMSPSEEEIEIRLQKEKFREEARIRDEVKVVLSDESIEEPQERVAKLVQSISESSKNDLVHYIAIRRNVLEIFSKSLERDRSGKHKSEGYVHDIIFPRRSDSETTKYNQHNLWIVDERLNFTDYISSDLPLNEGASERPDLAAYDKRIVFRGDNEASNPITIFEFKKPQRDDFVNHSSKEDPVEQIIRYVNNIRAGKYKTPEHRNINVVPNTPFFGYVICDINQKVEKWLEEEKDFTCMPDRLGWFQWREKIHLYIEVLSWDKVMRDAKMRNGIFFHHLKI